MTNRQIKWYQTRMIHIAGEKRFFDDKSFKSISMDMTKAEPILKVHYRDHMVSYTYQELKKIAPWCSEEERIANKSW